MSIRLYIGNLPKEEIDRQELQAIFAEEGDAVTTKLIKDRKTGKCRGFGFLTVNNDEQADQIIENLNQFLKVLALLFLVAIKKAAVEKKVRNLGAVVVAAVLVKPQPLAITKLFVLTPVGLRS
jgi:RNA recognition motif-containing protein